MIFVSVLKLTKAACQNLLCDFFFCRFDPFLIKKIIFLYLNIKKEDLLAFSIDTGKEKENKPQNLSLSLSAGAAAAVNPFFCHWQASKMYISFVRSS